jgi:hypothetical protein
LGKKRKLGDRKDKNGINIPNKNDVALIEEFE